MAIKYAVKNAFAGTYLAKADVSDRMYFPEREYAFHACHSFHDLVLFESKENAVKAYEKSYTNSLNETGVIVEMIISD